MWGLRCGLMRMPSQWGPRRGPAQPRPRKEGCQRGPCERAGPWHARITGTRHRRLCPMSVIVHIITSVRRASSHSAHRVTQRKTDSSKFYRCSGWNTEGREKEPRPLLTAVPVITNGSFFFFRPLQARLSTQRYTNQEGGGQTF